MNWLGASAPPAAGAWKLEVGRHLISDTTGCDPELLQDEEALNRLFETALTSAGATILSRVSHKFPGEGGVTGMFLLSESHASYHSYPEYGYIAVDIFTCGSCDPADVAAALQSSFSDCWNETFIVGRGPALHRTIRARREIARLQMAAR